MFWCNKTTLRLHMHYRANTMTLMRQCSLPGQSQHLVCAPLTYTSGDEQACGGTTTDAPHCHQTSSLSQQCAGHQTVADSQACELWHAKHQWPCADQNHQDGACKVTLGAGNCILFLGYVRDCCKRNLKIRRLPSTLFQAVMKHTAQTAQV